MVVNLTDYIVLISPEVACFWCKFARSPRLSGTGCIRASPHEVSRFYKPLCCCSSLAIGPYFYVVEYGPSTKKIGIATLGVISQKVELLSVVKNVVV